MTLNEHVKVDTTQDFADVFAPDDGYALWDSSEESNMDDNGNPVIYVLNIFVPKSRSEAFATNVFAKPIEEGMIIAT